MIKFSATSVQVPTAEDEFEALGALYNLAAERLGGFTGLKMVQITRAENLLLGTFTREYEEPEPVPADVDEQPADETAAASSAAEPLTEPR